MSESNFEVTPVGDSVDSLRGTVRHPKLESTAGNTAKKVNMLD